MTNIFDLKSRRQPVTFTLTITHDWDGTVSMITDGVATDPRSLYVVGEDLVQLGTSLKEKVKATGYVHNRD